MEKKYCSLKDYYFKNINVSGKLAWARNMLGRALLAYLANVTDRIEPRELANWECD